MQKKLIATLVLAMLALAVPALAGPPFICHPFDIGAAQSLPWGAMNNNYLAMRDDYDVRHVVADLEKLLTPSMPTIVRMETLRRAAIYASRDRAVAQQLLRMLMDRTAADAPQPDALGLFDAGYLAEALNELELAGRYDKQLRGLDRVLAGISDASSARAMLEKSLTLRPGDASIDFALGLISRMPENEVHFKKAREASRQDDLLAQNLARLQLQ
jgi:hypothetical protein